MRSALIVTVVAFFGLFGAAGADEIADHPGLRYAAGHYRPVTGDRPSPPAWYEVAGLPTSAAGRRYLVAITDAALDESDRARLEGAGADLLDYVPVHGYRLRIDPGAEIAVAALPFVRWLGEPPAWFKVHPDLAAAAGNRHADEVRVRVLIEADEPDDRALAVLAGTSPVSRPSGRGGAARIEASLPPGRVASILSRLAGLPEVEGIEPVRPLRLHNQDAVWVHQSFVGPSPQETPIYDQGIYGCGQIIAVSDSGQDHDLCHFRDPAAPPPIALCASAPCPAATPDPSLRKDIIYYNWSGTPTGDDDVCPGLYGASGHGTHTSGSAAADAPPYADCAGFTSAGRGGGDGQAPGARLVIQEMGDGLEYLNSRGGTVWNLADVAYRSGARIHSNSWGGGCADLLGGCAPGCTIPYDSLARDADLAMWTYPDLLMVFSAGNAGGVCAAPDAIDTPAIAKNPIAAGSVGHGVNAGTVSYFSSEGPVFDGRLKPTLAAQGEAVVSPASDADPTSGNCSTCSLDGTSMAAPTAAGLAALVREYYEAGFHPNGARDPSQGFAPSAALVKATLIDGAVTPGASAQTADFLSGHGRILLDSTLAFAGAPFGLRVDDHREGLVTGSVVTHAYDVSAGTPLRATLVWTDPPAALNAASARVNELRLEAVDPAGNAWFQTLDPLTGAPRPTSDPNDPHDPVNVEERIVFPSPTPGRWIFRVTGVDVAWGPQPFALVVRGDLADCVAPAVPRALALTAAGPNQVRIDWDPVPGAAAYNVYRALGSCPGGPWVRIAEALTATSYLDSGISGGATWSYQVTAAYDTTAACESPRSACADVVPEGDCFLAPEFAGVGAAASAGSSGCAIDLAWTDATPRCGTDVRYNVYRSTSPGFVPGQSTRIATCVIGTSYSDTYGLAHGAAYHYIVRAEDTTSGHGGPCLGGNEEGNLVEAVAAPDGPPGLGTWADDAGDTGSAALVANAPWTVEPTGGRTGPRVYASASAGGVCSDLVSPVLELASPALGPQLTFSTSHDLDYDPAGFFGAGGSIGQVEIATGPGFTNWTRVPLTPDYPATVELLFNQCSTTQLIRSYFTGTSAGYTTHTASLANWAGGDVRLRFHLSGDLLYPGGYWWIDDIAVTQAITPASCATLASGPPPIPDGATVPGQPLEATLSGPDLRLAWGAPPCAAAVNVYWGRLGDYSSFAGGFCGLPPASPLTIPLAGDVWFLVVATDGADADGSWSRDGAGNELEYAGASAACPAITRHMPSGSCP